MTLSQQIEAVLFWKAEPLSVKKIAQLLTSSEEEIKNAITELKDSLQNRGVTLIENGDEIMLGTTKEASTLIEKLTKEEISRDLGKAGLETLSIILYQGPISRADIDYIRGVNSQFIVRALLIRGLIERIENPKDARSFLYKPSIQLLAHLGVDNLESLPDYIKIRNDIENIKTTK